MKCFDWLELTWLLFTALDSGSNLAFGQDTACPNTLKTWNRTYIVSTFFNTTEALYRSRTQIVINYKNVTYFDSNSFMNLTALKSLDLGQNNMTCLLDENIFKSLANLEKLGFSENQLRSLNPQLFSAQTKLKELYINYNSLSSLDQNQFGALRNLKILHINQNKLASLPENIFNNLTFYV